MTPYSCFWWLRDRRHRDVTIAKQRGEQWFVFGGISGAWTEDEVREDYEILGRVAPFSSPT